ncbi:unnamed protein product [Spirodela intermedia]|uniref:Uncharacterized protein n=1 Tax=Spirodela intermedia TaxID=51605 RepID=A0A7I8IJT2_SPIIN|nr:unnamed protein product [Spirodela intermedia]CAA6657227.1 unnamed protein product [Spirodela intermedia]
MEAVGRRRRLSPSRNSARQTGHSVVTTSPSPFLYLHTAIDRIAHSSSPSAVEEGGGGGAACWCWWWCWSWWCSCHWWRK